MEKQSDLIWMCGCIGCWLKNGFMKRVIIVLKLQKKAQLAIIAQNLLIKLILTSWWECKLLINSDLFGQRPMMTLPKRFSATMKPSKSWCNTSKRNWKMLWKTISSKNSNWGSTRKKTIKEELSTISVNLQILLSRLRRLRRRISWKSKRSWREGDCMRSILIRSR